MSENVQVPVEPEVLTPADAVTPFLSTQMVLVASLTLALLLLSGTCRLPLWLRSDVPSNCLLCGDHSMAVCAAQIAGKGHSFAPPRAL